MAKAKAKFSMSLSYPHQNLDPNADTRTLPVEDKTVYKVERISNSTEYVPGQQLLKRQVDALCKDNHWDISMVPSKLNV